MLGLLGNERVKVTSSGGLATEDVVRSGVRAMPDINAIATRKNREIEVLVWNYHDDDVPFPAAPINLVISRFAHRCKTRSARTFPGGLQPQQFIHGVERDGFAAVTFRERVQTPGECRSAATPELTDVDRHPAGEYSAAVHAASARPFPGARRLVSCRAPIMTAAADSTLASTSPAGWPTRNKE